MSSLSEGTHVRLLGLNSRAELNGRTGKILRFVSGKDRWEVKVDGDTSDGTVAVKASNLECVFRSPDAIFDPEFTSRFDSELGSRQPSTSRPDKSFTSRPPSTARFDKEFASRLKSTSADELFCQPCEPSRISGVKYEIKQIDGKGTGLVAITSIARGECVLQERPLFLLDVLQLASLSPKDRESKVWAKLKDISTPVLNKYKALHDCIPVGDEKTAHGIWKTNALPATDNLAGVCVIASRLNHSCCPNINRYYVREKEMMVFHANRDIHQGEELCTFYCPIEMTYLQRQERLQRGYHFTCCCPVCKQNAESRINSDKLRAEFLDIHGKVARLENDPVAAMKLIDRAVEIIDKEFHGDPSCRQVVCYHGFQMALLAKDLGAAKSYMQQAYDAKFLSEGEHEGTLLWKDYMNDPATHRLGDWIDSATQLKLVMESKSSIRLPGPEAKFKLEDIEGKGMGLIATAAISCGECVLRERPAFLLKVDEMERLNRKNQEVVVRAQFQRLNEKDQKAFLALHDVITVGGSKSAYGIWKTNSLPDLSNSAGVCFVGCRFNHSCAPNINRIFWKETGETVFHAVRDILPGEELSTFYCSFGEPYAERHGRLEKEYRFDCRCPVCSLDAEARQQSDKLRSELIDIQDAMSRLKNDPSLSLKLMDRALEIIDLEFSGDPSCRQSILYQGFQLALNDNNVNRAKSLIVQAYEAKLLAEGDHELTQSWKDYAVKLGCFIPSSRSP